MIDLDSYKTYNNSDEYAGSALAYFTVKYDFDFKDDIDLKSEIFYIKSFGIFAIIVEINLTQDFFKRKLYIDKILNVLKILNDYKMYCYIIVNAEENINLISIKEFFKLFEKFTCKNNSVIISYIFDKYNFEEEYGQNIYKSQYDFFENKVILDINKNYDILNIKRNIFFALYKGKQDIFLKDLKFDIQEFKLNNKEFFVKLKYLVKSLSCFSENKLIYRISNKQDSVYYVLSKTNMGSLLMLYSDYGKNIDIKINDYFYSLNINNLVIIPLDITFDGKKIDFANIELFQRVEYLDKEIWFARNISYNLPFLQINGKKHNIKFNRQNVYNLNKKNLIIYCIANSIYKNYNIISFSNNSHIILSDGFIEIKECVFTFDTIENSSLIVFPRMKVNIFSLSEPVKHYNDFAIYKLSNKVDKVVADISYSNTYKVQIPQFVNEFDYYKDLNTDKNIHIYYDVILKIYAIDNCNVEYDDNSIYVPKSKYIYISMKDFLLKSSISKKLEIRISSSKKPIAYFIYLSRYYLFFDNRNLIKLN